TQGRLRLADVLTQMGQLSEAEEQYKMVAAPQPRIASGHFVLGLFYAMHQPERRDDALAAVKKALELQPEMKKLLVEHYAQFKALHDHPEFRALVS
ncbi:MAG: hypothetical protein HYZ00_00965, partial [Candidatus Hydrogenedentes bacterium]|nr:hypothetical protein [Candidatus Hydrogenedentota bacterium]